MTIVEPQLDRIQRRDADAFAEWMAGAEPRIRASLHSFAAQVDTEAVLQECLLTVWQIAPRFTPDGRPEALLRFAIRTARNMAIAELRRHRPASITPEILSHVMSEPDIPAPIPDEGLRRIIALCFEALPAKPHRAMTARLAGGGRRDEVMAASVKMTVNTFLQNIRRARLALAECLRRHGIEIGTET